MFSKDKQVSVSVWDPLACGFCRETFLTEYSFFDSQERQFHLSKNSEL